MGIESASIENNHKKDFHGVNKMNETNRFTDNGSKISSVSVSLLAMVGVMSSVLVGCSDSDDSDRQMKMLTAEQVKSGTVERVNAADITLASDQHRYHFDGSYSRSFTKCDGTVCGVSSTAEGVNAALELARNDPRFDFGSSHFGSRLEDSLEMKPQSDSTSGVMMLEGYGMRTDESPFAAKFFGGWVDGGAFFLNETVLTLRDGRGQPLGYGTVYDSSVVGVSSTTAPAAVDGMSGSWEGMVVAVDLSHAVTRGHFSRGEATLVVDDFDNPEVDVVFSNFHDIDTGVMLEGRDPMTWEDLSVDGGEFGDKPAGSDDYIQGHFVGENHAGVVGVFERNNFIGSFGANRQSSDM